ncbi:type II CAAX endopeptidase family protein [Glutamicibacter sp. PS]|uniref:CPBP family intramembrane glutamic endopeptidase n=1 Tax=Glutamicibacter sp. PS TaxID=3075634 RepID=UPI002848EAF5|nr:type II CAAX endopeptidase family protein [Glutamicibacter sp. PS]MDR4531939.1 CPBP family intramembrane metalloprotease [Glutamicibacter sp. PS]
MHEHDAPLAYHRLLRRDHRFRWWRPLALGGTTLGFYLVLIIAAFLVVFISAMFNPAFWMETDAPSTPFDSIDMGSPPVFIFTMVSLIALIPAVLLAYVLLGPKPWGVLLSVAGKLRTRWLLVALGLCLASYVPYLALVLGIEAVGAGTLAPQFEPPAAPLTLALLIILLVPFQAAAEELVFRGLLMQAVGSWLRHPAFAILLPIPLFTFGHLYDIYGLLDVSFFAVAAGYLTWRTGGLEAAIALHVVNNVSLFLLGTVGYADLNQTEGTLESLLISVGFMAIMTYILVKAATRIGIQRTADPLPPLPPRPPMDPRGPFGAPAPTWPGVPNPYAHPTPPPATGDGEPGEPLPPTQH